jgi:nicotinamide/nicotinate riboside kinase
MAKVQSLMDIKLFLLVSREKATQRREARDGYVTLEGFWQDPPGYMDKIVWPNYAAAHAWLFVDGNVEGRLNDEVLAVTGIQAQVEKGLDVDFEITLEWAVDTVMEGLMRIASQPKSH